MIKKWYHPSKPGELQAIPWLAPKVIAYLEKLMQPDWEIIEHGSGGSTLWFAERVRWVAAYEGNSEWREVVKGKLDGRDNFYLYTYPPIPSLHKGFDLLLIDGEPVEHRRRWIQAAPQIVKPGGWVVLDNANRPEYAKERKHLQTHATEIATFECNEGGTEYLVTEFYKMPEKGSE